MRVRAREGERQREGELEREGEREGMIVLEQRKRVRVCAGACVREGERQRERGREGEREGRCERGSDSCNFTLTASPSHCSLPFFFWQHWRLRLFWGL